MVAAKEAAGRRTNYVTGLRQYLNAFARGRDNIPIGDVTVEQLEEWFRQRKEAPQTQRSNMGRLSTVFEWAIKHDYLKANPVRKLEVPTVDRTPPKILTVDECEGLLTVTGKTLPAFLAVVVLVLFCGLRPDEARKVNWTAVNLTRRTVLVDSAHSKVHRRRVNELMEPGYL